MKLTFERSRVIGFSDAVFSVAMTLLILEVVVPSYQTINKYGVWDVLEARIPNFIGFIVSFFVTALYWIDYLKITKYTSEFTNKSLWANIVLLFFVVLLPFSTALYVNGINFTGPFVVYSINLTMIAVMIFILILIIAKEEEGKTGFTQLKRNWELVRMTNTISVWVLAAILAFVHIPTARFTFILIFVLNPLIDRYFKKKMINQEV
jgi:uncharacterized membrane protein